MPEIIGISGYAGSGKDTAAQALVSEGYERVAFADVLRDIAYALDPYVKYEREETRFVPRYEKAGWFGLRQDLVAVPVQTKIDRTSRLQHVINEFGWDRAKNEFPDVRRMLQRLGTEAGRDILGEDIWVNTAFARATSARIVVTDVRFPNEAEGVQHRGGRVVRIERPGTGPRNEHPSETSLVGYPFDLTIINDGTIDELHDKVRKALL